MGNCLMVFGFKKLKRPVTLLLVGLDNAGKTTAAKGIIGDSLDNVAPTVGFSPESLEYRGCDVTIYDLGGGSRIRGVWPKYFSESHGVIFVIDSSDKTRIEECQSVLKQLLSHKKVSGKPVLILANKQDVEGALDEIDVVESLKIQEIVNNYKCPTRVETCSAISVYKKKPDKPIADGFRWLIDTIVVHYKTLHKRVEKDVEQERQRYLEEMERRRERLRLLSEERKRRAVSEGEPMTNDRRDSEDVVVKRQNTEERTTPDEKNESVQGVTSTGGVDPSSSGGSASSTEVKELKELGFNSQSSIASSSSPVSSSSSSVSRATLKTVNSNPSLRYEGENSNTHLIEVHPSPTQESVAQPIVDLPQNSSQDSNNLQFEESPVRSSECVPIDSDDEVFFSPTNESKSEEPVSVNGSVTFGISEQIELEVNRAKKNPKRKNFLKRLHKTAPMVSSSGSAPEAVGAGGGGCFATAIP